MLFVRATLLLATLSLVGCAIDPTQDSASCTLSQQTTGSNGNISIRGAVFDNDISNNTQNCCDQIGQSFQVLTNTTTAQMEVKLIRVGYPSDGTTSTLTLNIFGGSETSGPTGTALATGTKSITSSSSGSSGTISTLGDWVNFTLTSTATLTASTVYWITLTADYTPSDTNVIRWMGTANDSYTRGLQMYRFLDTTWTSTITTDSVTSRDLTFRFGCP